MTWATQGQSSSPAFHTTVAEGCSGMTWAAQEQPPAKKPTISRLVHSFNSVPDPSRPVTSHMTREDCTTSMPCE